MLVGRTESTLRQVIESGPDRRDTHPWVGDVADLDAVTALMDGVAERFGRLDAHRRRWRPDRLERPGRSLPLTARRPCSVRRLRRRTVTKGRG